MYSTNYRDVLRYVREERKRFRGVQQMMSKIEELLAVEEENPDSLSGYGLALLEDFDGMLTYRESTGQLSDKALQRWLKIKPRVSHLLRGTE